MSARARDNALIAFEQSLRELMPELLRYFARRLGDAEDAADALSETLLVLWRRRKTVPQEREDFRRCGFGVARRVLLAARRGKLVRREYTDELVEELAVQIEPVEPDVDLQRALASLGESDRELVLLVAWEGFSLAEAASVLGIKPAAARQRYGRARARLRTELAPESVPLEPAVWNSGPVTGSGPAEAERTSSA